MKRNIIVTGATGMVGSEVVRQALLDEEIESVTAIVRRDLKMEHPKLRVIVHKDFLNFAGLESVFAKSDACLWCLGISQFQVSVEEYQVITVDYTVAAAEAMLRANPAITFLFLSGEGADSTERSSRTFAKYKGKTENLLRKLPFKKFYIARPAGIVPVHKKEHQIWYESLVVPILKIVYPPILITSVELSRALLHIVKSEPDDLLWNQKMLRPLGKKLVQGS